MKYIRDHCFINRATFLAACALLAMMLAVGSPKSVFAQGGGFGQGSEYRMIEQVQQAVRERIVRQEGGRDSRQNERNPTVHFNDDAQTISKSNAEVWVRGTGTFSRNGDSRNNDSRYNNSRNNDGRLRDFNYEAVVNTRNRNRNVSAIKYTWSGGWSGNGERNNDRDDNDRDRDDRDNNRDRNNRDRDDRDYNRGYGNGRRPDGRVTYSGPIMNRHSNKCLDVTERSNENGANIQQWSYSDQPNQNWEVIDLGNSEVAIISRQSGKALTVQGGRDDNGANIIQQGWNSSPQQRWRVEKVSGDYYRIVSVDNGKCLDVTERGKEDGASIQLWNYANQANQQWRLRK